MMAKVPYSLRAVRSRGGRQLPQLPMPACTARRDACWPAGMLLCLFRLKIMRCVCVCACIAVWPRLGRRPAGRCARRTDARSDAGRHCASPTLWPHSHHMLLQRGAAR